MKLVFICAVFIGAASAVNAAVVRYTVTTGPATLNSGTLGLVPGGQPVDGITINDPSLFSDVSSGLSLDHLLSGGGSIDFEFQINSSPRDFEAIACTGIFSDFCSRTFLVGGFDPSDPLNSRTVNDLNFTFSLLDGNFPYSLLVTEDFFNFSIDAFGLVSYDGQVYGFGDGFGLTADITSSSTTVLSPHVPTVPIPASGFLLFFAVVGGLCLKARPRARLA